MALWGNNDAKGAGGTVTLNYATLTVTGTGTTFGQVGAAATGDVIKFGVYTGIAGVGTYFGEAVIVGIASTTQLSIASTAGLSGVAIAGTSFQITEAPKYTVLDPHYNSANTSGDTFVYGVAEGGTTAAQTTSYELTHEGWVGIITYVDSSGSLRVKKETLVAMSGITTGNTPIYDGNPLA
jgi:hypothetical protein